MESNWKELDFPVVTYRPDVFILGGLDEVQVTLDDSQVKHLLTLLHQTVNSLAVNLCFTSKQCSSI